VGLIWVVIPLGLFLVFPLINAEVGCISEPCNNYPSSRVTDSLGNNLDSVLAEQQFFMSLDLQDISKDKQNILYLVQIKNEDDVVVSISWKEYTVSKDQSLEVRIPLIFHSNEKYVVETFVWESFDNPAPIYAPVFQTFDLQTIPNKPISDSVEISYNELGNKIEEKFDAFGNKIEKKIFNDNGEPIDFQQWEYDEHGNVIKHELFPLDFNISSMVTISEYDENNNKIKDVLYYGKDDLRGYTYWNYDENNNIIEKKTTNSNDSVLSIETTAYDSDGNIIEEKFTKGCCRVTSQRTMAYDSNGNMIEERPLNFETVLQSPWKKFTYDQSNKITDEKWFDEEEKLIRWIKYTYNQSNQITDAKKFDEENNLTQWKKYSYNQSNKITEEKWFDEENKLDVWIKYIYDQNNNLIDTITERPQITN